MPFWLTDESAAVLVQPSGAEVDIEPQRTVVDAQTEAVEWVLAEGQSVFVAGFAQRRSTDSLQGSAPSGTGVPERDDVFIGSAPDEPFVIAEHSRQSETSEQTRHFLFGVLVGGLYLLAALLLWIQRLAS